MQPFRQKQIYLFNNPVNIVFGRGSFSLIETLLKETTSSHVLVVSTPGLPALARLDAMRLGDKKTILTDISPNPQVEEIQRGIELARSASVDSVVGFGGGSAMDAAKVIAYLAPTDISIEEVLLKSRRVTTPSLFNILIPTTAGTGAEVTRWASLWDTDAKKKFSVEDQEMYARHALIDPELCTTLPPMLTAATGVDALSHACEASWSIHANPISDIHAREAVRLIFDHLPGAVQNPSNMEHREAMSFAATIAGLAFSNTKTAAAHSISYPMTLNFGTLHGQATGIMLAPLLRYNSEQIPEKMNALARAMGADHVEVAAEKIDGLLKECGMATRLSELGIDSNGIDAIIAEGFTPGRMDNNARQITEDNLRDLLTEIA